MNPHILEALIGGAIAAIPIVLGQLIFLGRVKQIFKDYPPHRHENGLTIYPAGMKPEKADRFVTGD